MTKSETRMTNKAVNITQRMLPRIKQYKQKIGMEDEGKRKSIGIEDRSEEQKSENR